MTRIIRLPVGFRVDKAGNVVRCTRHLDVSARLRQRSSKRVRARLSRMTTGGEGKTDRRDQTWLYSRLNWAVGSEIKA